MNILLLGEYSAFHQNLKLGLRELGHSVTLVGRRDGFKKIPVDLDFDSIESKYLKPILLRFNAYKYINQNIKDFDIVQVINPWFIGRYFPYKIICKNLIKTNNKVFLSACGDDSFYWKYSRKILPYGPFDDFLKYDLKSKHHFVNTKASFEYNKWLANNVVKVIPASFDYLCGYKNNIKNLSNVITYPVHLKNFVYQENIVNRKLVIYHGVNRYGYKGTRHVKEAFDKLSQKYPSDLELIIAENLPLEKYLNVIKRANVIVDQVNMHSYGMNAIFSLALGKVVLSGCSEGCMEEINVKEAPIINVTPCPDDIINKIEFILENKKQLREFGEKSRNYVEAHHDSLKIAQNYINVWNS